MSNLDLVDIPAHSAAAVLDLPSPTTKRWVVKRKAMVVAAVRKGTLSLQEACGRYNLSVEEFLACSARLTVTAFPACGSPGSKSIVTPTRCALHARQKLFSDTDKGTGIGAAA
jgi:hypothetical protein